MSSGSWAQRFCGTATTASADDCWLWKNAPTSRGYGQFFLNGKRLTAHRVAYELLVDDIPQGLVLDHLCRNRRCVNPWHLEPVTPRVNTLRGETQAAKFARRSHCSKGHALTPENTYANTGAARICRRCHGVGRARVAYPSAI